MLCKQIILGIQIFSFSNFTLLKVGALGCCLDNGNTILYSHVCPDACRPVEHKDWIHC